MSGMHFSIVLLIIASLTSCSILGSDEKEPPLEPGPRNYTWQVDTVANGPSGWLYDIWGSSPENVWAVASSGLHTLWHFDGENWEPSTNIYSFETVFGFSEANVWAGGADGKIYHFDGASWEFNYAFSKPGIYSASVTDIWGRAGTDVYAVGTFYMSNESDAQGFVLHYDGRQWREVLTTDFGVQLIRVRSTKDEIRLLGFNTDIYPDSMFFFKVEKNKLNELYSTNSLQTDGFSFNRIGDKIYYIIGSTINLYRNGEFKEWKTVNESEFGYQIYGRTEKDIFMRMNNGLAHYNGDDINYLFDFTSTLLSISFNAMLFDKEVFFLVNDFNNGTNLIYHGTLTEQQED